MEKVAGINPTVLVEAVRIWSGWGGVEPNRDDSRLAQYMGLKDADVLLAIIKQLEMDFYTSDARYLAANLEEMARLAKEDFIRMHPGISVEICDIFVWCYTFDFK